MLLTVTPGKPTILQDEPQKGPIIPVASPEIIAAGKAARLAGFVLAEFEHDKNRKNDRFVRRWLRFRRNFNGEYGQEFTKVPGKSDVFVRTSRERHGKAMSKILKLTCPIVGEPWDIAPSPEPVMAMEGDPFETAAAMKRRMKDRILNMGFRNTWRAGAYDMALYGTAVFKTQSQNPAIPRWMKLQGQTIGILNRKAAPWLKHLSPFDVYPDSNATCMADCGHITVRHVMNVKQLRDLGKQDGFDPVQVELVIQALPQGNYIQEFWESELGTLYPREPRYVVLERWGLVEEERQRDWGVEHPSKGFVESWSVDNFTLKIATDPFTEDELPFLFVPYERVDKTLWGRGPVEHMDDVQAMVNALVRGLHDNLKASSIPEREVDMTQLGPDVKLDGDATGRTWQIRPNELSQGRPAVRQWLAPNNSPQIIQALEVFERMKSEATSIPTMAEDRMMSSGVRTDGMQTAIFEQADDFLKYCVLGNIDEFFFEPFIGYLYNWEMAYGDDDSLKGDMQPMVRGVDGAVRRELIAKNALQLKGMANDPEFALYVNNPGIMRNMIEAMGLSGEECVLDAKGVAEKMRLMMLQQAMTAGMEQQSREMATHGIRAAMSRADAAVGLAKNATETNPAWGPMQQAAYEAQGMATPGLYEGLKVWALNLAETMSQQLGPQATQELQTMIQGFTPNNPNDLDPDFRPQNQAQPQAALAGGQALDPAAAAPQTLSPDAMTAIPTEQA